MPFNGNIYSISENHHSFLNCDKYFYYFSLSLLFRVFWESFSIIVGLLVFLGSFFFELFSIYSLIAVGKVFTYQMRVFLHYVILLKKKLCKGTLVVLCVLSALMRIHCAKT